MKIRHIYINAFGDLNDLKIDFDNHLQLIYGDNENGKKSIQQFIKAMFYGFGKSCYSAETNNRKKYMPWSGDFMSGSILFSHKDVDYRLQRRFGEKKSQDEIKLILDASGQVVHLKNQQQPGLELFQVSEAEFLNTVFIENPDIDYQNISELDAKLNTKVGLAEYDWSYEDMNTRLEKASKALFSEKSNHAYIQQLLQEKNNLDYELASLIQKDERISHLTESIQNSNKQLANLDFREKKLKLQSTQHQQLQIVEVFHQYQKLDEELTDIMQEESQLDAGVLKTGMVNVKDLTEIASQRQKVSYVESELDIKNNLLVNRQADKEKYLAEQERQKSEILKERSRLDYLRKKNVEKKPRDFEPTQMSFASFVPLIILETFLLLGGILLRKAMPSLSVILIVLAVLLPLLMVVLYFLVQRKQESKYKRYKQAIRNHHIRTLKIENELEGLEFSLRKIENRSHYFNEEIEVLENQARELEQHLEREKNKLRYLIKPYFTELPDDDQLDSSISYLREKTVENVQQEEKEKQIREHMQALRGDLSAAEFYEQYQQAQEWLIEHEDQIRTFPEFSENHIAAQLQGISEERFNLRESLAADKTNLDILQDQGNNTFDVEKRLRDLEYKLEQARFRYDSLKLALHLLNNSKNHFDQSVRPQLNQKAAEYLAIMTEQDYTDLNISQDFSIQVQEKDHMYRELAYYSAGLNDQINLALRLALTEMLHNKEDTLPLILDDPFIQIDEKRSLASLKLLNKIADEKNRQILLFTSQASINQLVEKLDKNAQKKIIRL